jgi:hypothetical protein
MSRKKGIDSRSRQKEWEQKRKESRSTSSTSVGSALPATIDYRSWPIVRAYVPVEDVFRATGFGSAGIIRLSPEGKWFTSFFIFGLLDAGISAMFGKDQTDEEENAETMELFEDKTPALEPGPPELAARYIWGAYAMGMFAGYEFDPQMSARYLGMVPKISGSKNWWLQQFLGPQGLAAPELVQFLEDHPVPDNVDIPDDKEIVVFTAATFSCADSMAVVEGLRRRTPEFGDGREEDGVTYFSWTREYPKKHWSPFSLMGGRQVLGSVEVHHDHLVAEAKVLSMASILIAKLKRAFGNDIKLMHTQWKGAKEVIREAKDAENQ